MKALTVNQYLSSVSTRPVVTPMILQWSYEIRVDFYPFLMSFVEEAELPDASSQDSETIVEHLICTKPLPTRYVGRMLSFTSYMSGYPRKRQGIWKFCQITRKTQEMLSKHRENTGNFISSSCKCSDSKSKGYCDSCGKKIHFFPEAG